MKTRIIGSLVLCLLLADVFGQQSQIPAKQETAKWRTVGAVAGAAGGFLLGLGIGLAKYDDAINSDRKVWTVTIISTVAGGIGGYFAGRAIDRHNAFVWILGPEDRSLLRAQNALAAGEPLPPELLGPGSGVIQTSQVALVGGKREGEQ